LKKIISNYHAIMIFFDGSDNIATKLAAAEAAGVPDQRTAAVGTQRCLPSEEEGHAAGASLILVKSKPSRVVSSNYIKSLKFRL